ncbi:PREDICTED: nuclear factor NF-kappa-B p110 subunit-like isoform X1 [Priapulus caudatus]|uniref:Nuclear factor NF-kappa-B p110 subunit-like isoform X1 n=1 Tax=Priapulus caudatus TaxID=37621 RepID=A0ABM1F9Q3_PRICU|nr:PREDICTED: nuclear factor NF-kappa-B p110 subunit-like isoform X1 [Priapulus caudatus]
MHTKSNWEPPQAFLNKSNDMTAVFNDISIVILTSHALVEMSLKMDKLEPENPKVSISSTEREKHQEYVKKRLNEFRGSDRRHVAVIKFQAFQLNGDGSIGHELCYPAYSNKVVNQRSTQHGELKIIRISRSLESCRGGKSRLIDRELLLFTSKIKKGVNVRFYDHEGWAKDVEPSLIHEQTAVSVLVPPYKCQDLKEEVQVHIRLVRQHTSMQDEELCGEDVSEPVTMKYQPVDVDVGVEAYRVGVKRCKLET